MDGGSSFADHFKRTAPEGSRSGGRRKSRGGAAAANEAKKKKTPQRGMGVAQLERLRLQADHQRLKMNSNNNPLSVNVTVPAIVHHAPPIVFSPAAACGGGAAVINGAAAIPFQFPLSAAAASLGGSHHDLYGFGNYSNLFHAGNVKENSKELSSTPNFTPSLSDHHHQICNVCHKV
nr:Protein SPOROCYTELESS like [Ipomoea batatas]